MSTEVKPELQALTSWLGTPKKSDAQANRLNESDCEVVKVRDDLYLASTIDTLSEELSSGLYKDFYTIGWVTAAASLSDLCASGTEPLGLMLSTTWPHNTKTEDQKRFAAGFLACADQAQVCLLGGDQNFGPALSVSSVGLGTSSTRPLMRSGAKPGDLLCLLSPVGLGPMMGIGLLIGKYDISEEMFRPAPKPRDIARLRPMINAAIDLSDGLVNSCFDLARNSRCSIELTWTENAITPAARSFCETYNLPFFLNWLGEHGDFALLAAVSPQHLSHLQRQCPEMCMIGQFESLSKNPAVSLSTESFTQRPIPYDWCTWSQRLSVKQMVEEFAGFSAQLRNDGWP